MRKQTRIRLCLALFMLAVAAGIVGLPSAPEAVARPCCQECDANFFACTSDTANGPCYGDFTCCHNQSSFCYNHCVRCFDPPLEP